MKKIVLQDYSPIEGEENKKYCRAIQEYINEYPHNIVVLKDELEEDKRKKPKLFDDKCEYTKSYVGVIKGNINTDRNSENVTLHINSRFDKKGEYKFLNYVFSQAFDSRGRIFENMDNESSDDSTWDSLLMILYVKQLEDALRQGSFRQYITYEYNDSKVKGKIDISRHIKLNPIENGKIAYSTREYTIDNPINHLILQAYECLSKKYGEQFKTLIRENKIVKDGILNLKMNIPDLNKYNKKILLNKVSKPIYHSVYIKYEQLRKTSISIIRRLGLNIFDECDQEVQGILIPVAKLWERFLYNVIFKDIENGSVKEQYKIQAIKKINDHKREFDPDFYLKNKFVFDAKYRKPWSDIVIEDKKNEYGKKDKKTWPDNVREDVFQVLSYMLAFNVKVGGTIFPVPVDEEESRLQKDELINDYIISDLCQDRKFYIVPYKIPTYAKSQSEFNELMEKQNEYILEKIKLMYNN